MDIAIVGEAWGAEEDKQKLPFVGAAGYELTKMLSEAGIHRADCFLTNVFNFRPAGNRIEEVCGGTLGRLPNYPALAKGKYVREEFAPELERLADELISVNPNLVLALGNTAMWALTGRTAISKLRGATVLSTHCVSGFKILPTYHPAAVLRQWDLRPVAVIDLQKAKRESVFPEIRRPAREIWIEPTLEDIHAFFSEHVRGCEILSVDIETAGRDVTCFGVAPSRFLSLVIPFFDGKRKDRSYWPTKESELEVWGLIRDILESPRPRKLFQNGLYDIAFLYKSHGIRVAGAAEDTMLLHYSLQPESLKGLGFLGSVYCDEGAWKEMRGKKGLKRDD